MIKSTCDIYLELIMSVHCLQLNTSFSEET